MTATAYQINGMDITDLNTTPDSFTVESSSGKTYHVEYAGAGDSEAVDTWHCNCPARKTCKHIKAVANLVNALIDDDREQLSEWEIS